LRRDRQRVLAKEVLDRTALDAQHRATFEPSVDLMLLAADSPLRAADVPELITALAWCSTVRDLDADLARGLVNIPADVMARARNEPRAVSEWLDAERKAAIPLLDACDSRIAGLRGQRGAKLLARFSRSMRRYTRT
jgi:hypothetical protein